LRWDVEMEGWLLRCARCNQERNAFDDEVSGSLGGLADETGMPHSYDGGGVIWL